MIQILQEKRKPSFGQQFSQAVGSGLEMMGGLEAKRLQEQKNQQIKNLTGMDVPPELHQKAFEAAMQRQLQQEKYGFESQKAGEKLKGEQQEKIAPLQGAMETLNRMKSLRKKGNLGIGSTYSPFGETRKQAGEYEQLGKSLIQYATNIPIRNRIEFETLAENLYDPTTTDAKAEGILNAMEMIIQNAVQSAGGAEGTAPRNQTTAIGTSQKRPLSSFSIGAK